MSEKNETVRPEARLPKGLFDASAGEIRATAKMLATIRDVFESYGFEPLDTPGIEYTDALGKFLPDQDRPNEGVFSFKDDDDQWLSLRYDLTAPLARYVAENYQTLPKPFRRYQSGPVWRNEKPGAGRFRQFTQFDADTVGASSVAADAELCMLAADTLEALGVPRGQYVVKVNNRKILDGVLDAAKVSPSKRLTVLRAIDKLDRLGIEGVRALLGKGRRDESGDYTEGADLSAAQIEMVETLWRPIEISGFEFGSVGGSGVFAISKADDAGESQDMEVLGASSYIDNAKTLDAWEIVFAESPAAREGIRELKSIISICRAAGYGSKRVRIDSSVVRGLEYYTGTVFEADLTFEVIDDKGRSVRFGSVGAGGRYDGLVGRFLNEAVPATGFSVGVSRLLSALIALRRVDLRIAQGPVVVLVFQDQPIENYQLLVNQLRKPTDGGPPIRAEMYLGSGKIGAQTKYADRRGSPCVVIQGGDEKARGEVQIKDLILGAMLSSIKDRDEYLKKQAEAQFAVPESELVGAVRRVLSRHKA